MKNKVGVWGLGTTGTSVLAYLSQQNYILEVTDRREPSLDELAFLQRHNITYNPDITSFLDTNKYIVPSPGIDLRPFNNYKHKWLCELDLFQAAWHKPLIAVTGTVGKTSVVFLLTKILEHYNKQVAMGGNIGTGMLDLIAQQESADCAVLEVSSFQLELTTSFAPDLAIWTNLYPNHLDRHNSLEEYFQAKYKILTLQNKTQQALVPFNLQPYLAQQPDYNSRTYTYFSPLPVILNRLREQDTLYTLENNSITKYTNNRKTILFDSTLLPALSYRDNWLILLAACDMLNLPLEKLLSFNCSTLPAHRLDKIAVINGITFYNDSKSTIPQATLAALEQLHSTTPYPIHLFLGGVSKGVDRIPFISQLKDKVCSVFCFGAEADLLYNACKEHHIATYSFKTLEEAFNASITQSKPGDIVLFSPAGASFDLFKNYEERGDCFIKLVKKYQQNFCKE